MQLSLRTLVWLLFAAAVVVGWGWERWGYLNEFEKASPIAWTLSTGPAQPSPAVLARQAELDNLAALSDQEFRAQLPSDLKSGWGQHDVWLIEMARRGMTADLKAQLEQLSKDHEEDAALLTMLRRAEGKPDPVRIEVKFVPPGWEKKGPPSQWVEGVVSNGDVERRRFTLMVGGDYRSGRRDRWRVELRDEQGRRVENSNFFSGAGGGLGGPRTLEYGQESEGSNAMDPRNYVQPPSSGRYQLQLIHSDTYISDESDLTGLVVWKSEPIWVEVVNRDEAFDWTCLRPLFATLLALLLLAVAHLLAGRPSEGELPRFVLWGDVAACGLVIVLSLGWWFDARQLRAHLARLQPDSEANWTIVAPTPAGQQ